MDQSFGQNPGMSRRLVVSVIGIAVLVAGGVVGVRSHQLHQLPGAAGPGQVVVCGRTFVGPGTTRSSEDMRNRGATRIGSVPTWQGAREVWGRHVTIGGAPGCGTGVYLRTGSTTFLSYALSGGP